MNECQSLNSKTKDFMALATVTQFSQIPSLHLAIVLHRCEKMFLPYSPRQLLYTSSSSFCFLNVCFSIISLQPTVIMHFLL